MYSWIVLYLYISVAYIIPTYAKWRNVYYCYLLMLLQIDLVVLTDSFTNKRIYLITLNYAFDTLICQVRTYVLFTKRHVELIPLRYSYRCHYANHITYTIESGVLCLQLKLKHILNIQFVLSLKRKKHHIFARLRQ